MVWKHDHRPKEVGPPLAGVAAGVGNQVQGVALRALGLDGVLPLSFRKDHGLAAAPASSLRIDVTDRDLNDPETGERDDEPRSSRHRSSSLKAGTL